MHRFSPLPAVRDFAPDASNNLETFLASLLAKDPEGRPSTAAQALALMNQEFDLAIPQISDDVSRSYLRTPALVGRDRGKIDAYANA